MIRGNALQGLEDRSDRSHLDIFELADKPSTARITGEDNLACFGMPPPLYHNTATSLPSRQSRWPYRETASHASIGANGEAPLKQLMLQWEKDGSNRLVFNTNIPKGKANVEAPSYISWQCDQSPFKYKMHMAHHLQTLST